MKIAAAEYAFRQAPKVRQAVTTFGKPIIGWTMALALYRAIGLFGAAIYVVAYFANQARWLKAEDWRFPAANLAGALLILVSLSAEWTCPRS
jgi:hypothetical protein